MSHFRKDITAHKRSVGKILTSAQMELATRAINHDLDKIEDDTIFDTYEQHSEAWRNAPFRGNEKSKLRKVMAEGIDKHVATNRHHFYGKENTLRPQDINLFDMMENLSDWIAASERDCHTNDEKMERISMLINQYYRLDDTGTMMLRIILLNTAKELINKNY